MNTEKRRQAMHTRIDRRCFLRTSGLTAAGLLIARSADCAAGAAAGDGLESLGLTGNADSTAAIRKAMDAARQRGMTIYFPGGEYSVSDTLEYAFNRRTAGQGGGDSPCQMLGERGAAKRAKIVLAPAAPGFGDPTAPKPVVHIWARSVADPSIPQPNISMNNVFINIDIEIGPGNPGAIGIHHDAAQGSGIEDVTVHAGDGYAGIVGLQAGGGGEHNISVIGGRIGLDASKSKATSAVVSGATFIGQSESAVRYGGLETLCLVGARIVVPKGAKGPAIRGEGVAANSGVMAIVDTEIRFESPGAANAAIGSNRSVYLNNVWIDGCGQAVATEDGGRLEGNPGGWCHIAEYAHGVRPPRATEKWDVQLEHVNYIDGKRRPEDIVELGGDGAEPPADLQSRHQWLACPAWNAPGVVNVKTAPYNAKGDGKTDDADALQRAIDENEVLFLPKGQYCVSRTLVLGSRTKIVGLRSNSAIRPLYREGGVFSDAENPQPIVRTADDAAAETALAYLTLAWDPEHPGTCYFLDWRAGRRSVVRSIHISSGRLDHYHTRIGGNGGGRWYSQFKSARMAIEGTREPIRMYQANPEWGARPHMHLKDARDVTIYAFKNEGPNAALIQDCDKIDIFGYGGIANAAPGKALFTIERTPNIRLAGLMDRVFKEGTPPTEWHMVADAPAGGPAIHTEPLDRIVLYRRGESR